MPAQKTVLITGASRRLGLFLCEQFCHQDCNVIALTRSISRELHQLAERFETQLACFELEEYHEKNIARTISVVTSSYPHIDIVIHNASIFETNTEFSREIFQQSFDVHMAMPAQLNEGLKECLYREDQPGVVVHITDIYAENPNKAYTLYCATKAGLENLSKGFAKKFAPGIRVNSIQPGPIKFLDTHNDAEKAQVLSETLLNCEGGFMPIFQAISSVIENPYMTGATIKVDGGRALGTR
ncbi:MAG: SDR family NAD(P)-dependent oxidoreductase [Agarilytica sp.]